METKDWKEKLLYQPKNGWERTDAARELSEHFAEIMIDEYQDSNYVQEYLLEAVAAVYPCAWLAAAVCLTVCWRRYAVKPIKK